MYDASIWIGDATVVASARVGGTVVTVDDDGWDGCIDASPAFAQRGCKNMDIYDEYYVYPGDDDNGDDGEDVMLDEENDKWAGSWLDHDANVDIGSGAVDIEVYDDFLDYTRPFAPLHRVHPSFEYSSKYFDPCGGVHRVWWREECWSCTDWGCPDDRCSGCPMED